MRLNILRRKIRKKNKFEILNDQEKTSRLTYQGLNRYQNFLISNKMKLSYILIIFLSIYFIPKISTLQCGDEEIDNCEKCSTDVIGTCAKCENNYFQLRYRF